LDCLAQKTGIPVRSTIRRLPLLDGDPQSLPVLAQLLQSGEEKAQLVAIEGLWRMGDDARPAVPALVEALDDENDKVSGDAAIVLYSLDLQALLRHPSFRGSARQADTP
jgi:HEAT repeat protein